jgi:hypothetical protein
MGWIFERVVLWAMRMGMALGVGHIKSRDMGICMVEALCLMR